MAEFKKNNSIMDGVGEQDGGGKTLSGNQDVFLRLPYGLAKKEGIDTTGMTPKQVWEALKGKGINPQQEMDKLAKSFGNKQKDNTNEDSYISPKREYKHKEVIDKYGLRVVRLAGENGPELNTKYKDIPSKDMNYIEANRKEIADEIAKIEDNKERNEFFSKEQILQKHYGYKASGSDYINKNYEEEVIDRTFEEYKQKNPDYDGDGYPYMFPPMNPEKLIKTLDETKAKINAETEATKKKEEEAKEKERAINQTKFEEAKKTGKPVLLKREGGMTTWNFENGKAKIHLTYAMPDGTTKKETDWEIWD